MSSSSNIAPIASTSSLKPTPTTYEATSQFLRWRSTPAKLESNRKLLVEKARRSCENNWKKEEELQLASNPSYTPRTSTSYPSHNDELLLISFYLTQLSLVLHSTPPSSWGRSIPPPVLSTIEQTSISYLKRFYLRTSCLEHHPKTIMPVCIFLAAKVCNCVLEIDRFVGVFEKLRKEEVLEGEYLVVMTLKWDLCVVLAGETLKGWYLRLQDPSSESFSPQSLSSLLPQATHHLKQSRLTDAEFLYTPSQIALACWRMAMVDASKEKDEARDRFDEVLRGIIPGLKNSETSDPDHPGPDLILEESKDETDPNSMEIDATSSSSKPKPKHDLKSKNDSNPSSTSSSPASRLLPLLDEIESLIRAVPDGFDIKKVKVVDKAVRSCLDPIKNKSSLIYKRKQEKLESIEAEKRALKISRARKEMSAQDTLFGPIIPKGGDQNGTNGHGHDGVDEGLDAGAVIGETGMGIKEEGGGGMMFAGEGLRDVGMMLSDSESD